MLQRYFRPCCFLILLLSILFCSFFTGQGITLAEPSILLRFSHYFAEYPMQGSMLLFWGIPAGLVFFLLPESMGATLSITKFGIMIGGAVFIIQLLLAGFLLFYASRYLLRPSIRTIAASAELSNKIYLSFLSSLQMISLETCLFLETLFLLLPLLPFTLLSLFLGLTSMSPRAFGVAAVPLVFFRTATIELATVHASGWILFYLSASMTLLFCFYLIWINTILQRRMHRDAMEGPASRQLRRRVSEPQEKDIKAHEAIIQLTRKNEKYLKDAVQTKDEEIKPSTDNTLIICVEDPSCQDSDVVELVRRESSHIGCPVIACRLLPRSDYLGTPVDGGFEGHDQVSDLEEIFQRAFNEGFETVLAVRAVTPLVRASLLLRALTAISRTGLALGPCGNGFWCVGLRRQISDGHERIRRYEPGILAGRTFEADLTFALSGLCPRPETLPFLPLASELAKPLVSVIIPSFNNASVITNSVASACAGPWTECLVVDGGSSDETTSLASQAGAEVIAVHGCRASRMNEATRTARGKIFLFLAAGSRLPNSFDAAAWETLQQENCCGGSFGLPEQIPALSRAMIWFSSVLRPGSFGLPTIEQGIFVERDKFQALGGFFEKASEGDDVAEFIHRLTHSGRFIIHNSRIQMSTDEIQFAIATPRKKLNYALAHFSEWIHKLFCLHKNLPTRETDVYGERIRAMSILCDHCGACTKVCPMLSRRHIDIQGLAARPLLAWNCFLCGQCTRACPQGIDGALFARTLREQYVHKHGGRMARPGHSRTIWLSRLAPISVRFAAPGKNLLLDINFCTAFPKTTIALLRLFLKTGLGVVVADCGARLSELGMEKESRRALKRLTDVITSQGVTCLVTISPSTHVFIETQTTLKPLPIYAELAELGVATKIDVANKAIFTPCMDRGQRDFANSLEPFLDGEVRTLDSIACCGAGGEANIQEPDIAASMKQAVRNSHLPVITTCTECVLALERANCHVDHALSLLLQTWEKPVFGVSQVRSLAKLLACLSEFSPCKSQKVTLSGMEQTTRPFFKEKELKKEAVGKEGKKLESKARNETSTEQSSNANIMIKELPALEKK